VLQFTYSSLIFPLVCTLSTVFLIVWPVYLLWGVDLPQKERRLVLILFASTVFMTPFVAVHTVYSYHSHGTVEATLFVMTAHIEVSSFICDLVSGTHPLSR
jgi:hypothetical protein